MNLSVIIPAWNAERHISVALDSLARQTAPVHEVIIVDDGSDDATSDRCADLLTGFSESSVHLIRQDHAGVSAARNRGLSVASGDYVLFLDSDDEVADELMSRLNQDISDRPDIVAWGWDVLDPSGTLTKIYFAIHPVVPLRMTGVEALERRVVDRSLRIWTASAAYRRQFLVDRGLAFTVGCECGEDLEFVYKALAQAEQVAFVPHTLAYYRKRSASSSNTPSVGRLDSIEALRRAHDELAFDDRPEVRAIAEQFAQTKFIGNYFHTLQSCMLQRADPDVRALMAEIRERYPGLSHEMCCIVRERVVAGNYVPLEFRLFLRSPRYWWWYLRARRALDLVLPPRLRSTGSAAIKRRARLLVSDFSMQRQVGQSR